MYGTKNNIRHWKLIKKTMFLKIHAVNANTTTKTSSGFLARGRVITMATTKRNYNFSKNHNYLLNVLVSK